jgi:hypothetical protein
VRSIVYVGGPIIGLSSLPLFEEKNLSTVK